MNKKQLIDMTIEELMDFCISHDCDSCPLYFKACNESEDIYGIFFNKNIDEIELNIDNGKDSKDE